MINSCGICNLTLVVTSFGSLLTENHYNSTILIVDMRWTWTGRSLAMYSLQPALVQPVCSPQSANVQPTSSPQPTHVHPAFSPPLQTTSKVLDFQWTLLVYIIGLMIPWYFYVGRCIYYRLDDTMIFFMWADVYIIGLMIPWICPFFLYS